MANRNQLAIVALALAIGTAAPVTAQGPAQAKSLQQLQVDDLKTMKDKFVGLADAFPADKYDWRPMEGVRSVKEVLILITTEGNGFPTQWGAPAAAGVNPDRNAEMARLTAMSKAELSAAVGKAFDNMIGVVQGMDQAARAKDVRFFGSPARVETAILMATGDMHEHLGQMIAYARSNRIVPPWSQ